MPIWNTKTINSDLSTIVGITNIVEVEGEDVTTDGFELVIGGAADTLLVRGFDPKMPGFIKTDNVEVCNVELTDGLSHLGGLNSTDFRVARAYIDVRQYFINRGFTVVPSLDDYS